VFPTTAAALFGWRIGAHSFEVFHYE